MRRNIIKTQRKSERAGDSLSAFEDPVVFSARDIYSDADGYSLTQFSISVCGRFHVMPL